MRAWIGRTEPHREPPHHAQAPRPSGMLHIFGKHRPAEGQFRRDEFRPLALQKIYELLKSFGGLPELCAQGSAHSHVLPQSLR